MLTFPLLTVLDRGVISIFSIISTILCGTRYPVHYFCLKIIYVVLRSHFVYGITAVI